MGTDELNARGNHTMDFKSFQSVNATVTESTCTSFFSDDGLIASSSKTFLTFFTSPSPHSQMFMGGRMAELLENKEGLTITDQLDFGSVTVGESKTLTVWIR